MRIDLNLNPVVGGKVRVMCKSYRQATKKKAKLERAYPDSCYLIGQDTMGYFILRTKWIGGYKCEHLCRAFEVRNGTG